MQNYNQGIQQQLRTLVDLAQGLGEKAKPCLEQVPSHNYSDALHFEREMQACFQSLPLIICHSSELNQEHNIYAHQPLGLPIVTLRDETGKVRSFLNACRHRSMQLVNEGGFQSLRSLVCPYHQWTYGLDGCLRHVPLQDDFSELKKEDHGLVELPCEERDGLVWLQLDRSRELNLDHHLAGIGQDLQDFKVDSAQLFCRRTHTVKANWKLIHDAFLDGYHVTRLHKKTVGAFFPDCVSVIEEFGMHSRASVGRNESVEADPANTDSWNPRVLASFSYTLFPNSVIIMHPDYTSLVTLFPQKVDQTLFVHSMLVHEAIENDKARDHFQRSFDLIDQGVFAAEDLFVCEGTQQALKTGANEHLSFGANEKAVYRFHEKIAELMTEL